MRLNFLYITFLSTIFLSNLQAQLSPGDLAAAHAHLEGISNCTQCHILGEKVSNDKCLACHKEIKTRIDRQTGYHSSREVKGKDCAECHSDHHGRKFDMIRFDEDKFNHDLTDYKLTGAHQKIDCRQCHIPDFIEDRELKKRKETFLGLDQDCISCHADYHQNTLSSNDCASCHTTEVFSPASKFDHNETDYALAGKHKEVECIECHKMETRSGKEFQHFTGLEFNNCNSCHDDAHLDNLGSDCKACHIEESFSSLVGLRNFNHSQTHFPLKGKHKQVDCAQCHTMNVLPERLFQDRLGTRTNDCISCHEDAHDNKFGSNCSECHNETSFRRVNMDNFNHSRTDFKLLGKHEAVDCKKCHTQSFTEPLPHNECAACHVDYHEGQFVNNGVSPDCAQCHTEDGFEGSLFTFEDHSKTKFPLEGAHIATPCFACHLQDEKWSFRAIGERCVDCHDDVHEGYIDKKYYPDRSCENCHVSIDWVENRFDHNLTGFELLGAHTKQKCMDCHSIEVENQQNRYEGFIDLPATCFTCHENVHERQFEKDGVTDCARCHGFESWGLDNFNHDKTAFKLEGKHAEIACDACHKEIESEGKIFTQYKFESFECIDCHK